MSGVHLGNDVETQINVWKKVCCDNLSSTLLKFKHGKLK